jgi:TatD DNase family protein
MTKDKIPTTNLSFTDSHAHPYDAAYTDRDSIIAQSIASGVDRIYIPNIDVATIDPMLEITTRHPTHCFPMMGLHPCHVDRHFARVLYEVEAWLDKRPFAAVGEVGLDKYRGTTYFAQQQEALQVQIDWAASYKIPLVLHMRAAEEEGLQMIEAAKRKYPHLKAVFHCYSGDLAQAHRIAQIGCYIGIGGMVTFAKNPLRTIVPHIDLAHILLETDSPYLAPVPYRGKRNTPAYIPYIAHELAQLQGIELAEVARVTTQNATDFFTI